MNRNEIEDEASRVLQKSRGFIAPGKLESTNVEVSFLFLASANFNSRILGIDELYLFFIHRLTEPAMSVSALHIYEQLTDAPDDKTRARIIAEAIGQLEDRYPQLREVATQPQLRETELRLQKEIELTRLEIKEVEAKLQKEIELTRLEIKEVEAKLHKEIQQTRLEIKEVEAKLHKEIQQTRVEIKEVEAKLQKEIQQTRLEIKEVEARLSKEIHLLDLKIAENTCKIAETKAELVRWVVGVGLLQTTLISGILLKVAHLI